MRDHNKTFCRLAAQTFDCPGPIVEFGSYQVEGQEDYANLRSFFPGKPYLGCDMRLGPGVDRVEDVTAIKMGDGSAGTVLCIETFEHVFQVWRAFDEVYRILKPGGIFVITSPLNFRIHAYPDDYWRMTPSCLRRMMTPYDAKVTGYQGHDRFPHSVMALGVKGPLPGGCAHRLTTLVNTYHDWLRETETGLPIGEKLRRGLGRIYRSKGERNQIASYYDAAFTIDGPDIVPMAKAG
jgi:SAM-dependent methyltransferase